MPARKYDWEAIKALFISGKTAKEIAAAFGCSAQLIHNKSKDDSWGILRKQFRSIPPTAISYLEPKMQKCPGAKDTTVVPQLVLTQNKAQGKPQDAFSRALRMRSSDGFREQVIGQAHKVLSVLDRATPNNVFECDRFAEALTKVERIGARAYGYDRESEHPIINIGILGSGQEYEPAD